MEDGGITEDRFDPRVLHVRKVTAYLAVPNELLMDAGAIEDTRPPLPRPSRRRRLHWWWQGVRVRAGETIAGQRFDDEDCW
jgi:hypothetical protein